MKWTERHSANAKQFSQDLKSNGYNFFTGVPCSLLGALIDELSRIDTPYIAAPREDSAMGLASGAYLAGKLPAILIQNSGLGYSLNVLTSLNLIYRIPMLCLISYRGQGPDAPEHILMGKTCIPILKEIGIPCFIGTENTINQELKKATDWILRERTPAALFVTKGIFGA